jgi:hypothetical protein
MTEELDAGITPIYMRGCTRPEYADKIGRTICNACPARTVIEDYFTGPIEPYKV